MNHIVSFLLVAGFKDGNQRKFAVEPGILLILR